MSETSDGDWNDRFDELCDNPLNFQVWLEFQDAGPDLAEKLIAMLDSSEPVTSEVCALLAQALKAGLNGDSTPGELQLRVFNDGQRKPGHRKYREDKRRESIARAKKMQEFRERFGTRSLLSTLGEMSLAGIEMPGNPSQSTLEKDEALYKRMRKWIEVDGYPMLWKMMGEEFVASWRQSSEAEDDFIRYGAEFDKNKKGGKGKNRSQ